MVLTTKHVPIDGGDATMAEDTITIMITRNCRIAGESYSIGETATIAESVARQVVNAGRGMYQLEPPGEEAEEEAAPRGRRRPPRDTE